MKPCEKAPWETNVSRILRTCSCEGRYDYLLALRAVIAATAVRFHVGLVACRVNAFLGKTNHAFADLQWLSVNLMFLFMSVHGTEDVHLRPERGS